MAPKIIPITLLRDPNKIDELIKSTNGPIYVTKNGYNYMVMMSDASYKQGIGQEGKTEFCSFPDNNDGFGFVRVAALSPKTTVGNPKKNVDEIIKQIKFTDAQVIVFPELCISGYTCADLLLSDALLEAVEEEILRLSKTLKGQNKMVLVGAPLRNQGRLYNCAVVLFDGDVLGVIAKSKLPNYGEFYEERWFQKSPEQNGEISLLGKRVPFGPKLIFVDTMHTNLKIGIEICEDAWLPFPPSDRHALMGATLLCNLSASDELVSKEAQRKRLVESASQRTLSAYVYSDCGPYESSTDLSFAGQNIIVVNGETVVDSGVYGTYEAIADIDIDRIFENRVRKGDFYNSEVQGYSYIGFNMPLHDPKRLVTPPKKNPYVLSENEAVRALEIQKHALAKRLLTTKQRDVILGLSGGLDSALALLVAYETFKMLGYNEKGIHAYSLPCFGTTKRTKTNSQKLAESLGVSFKEVNIGEAVSVHLKDLGQDETNHNIAYENAQARERTQFLMDKGNQCNALLLGTGDLSELCLGWCTYGGDQISMYGLNAGLTKTAVRSIVSAYAKNHDASREVLLDILDTPITPELLPSDGKTITQVTEDNIGPYDLNDFYIWCFLENGFSTAKSLYLAEQAFAGQYDRETLKKWLHNFYARFFRNQFKRSCSPDGVKILNISVSPRGDLRFPSDGDADLFLKKINEL